MNSIWPQLEPLLAKVQKPARYIGCEDGAQRPDHHPDQVAWLLIYPDTYEIGLPNQGLQILYEILNERADARGRADLRPVDRPRGAAARRTACRCSRSTPTGRPATSTCWPSTCRPSSSTPTCSTASTWPACRCGRPTAAPSIRWSSPAATAPTTPSRSPTSSTWSCSATARRSVSEITEVVGRVEGGGPHRGLARAGAARAGPGPGRLRAVDVRGHLRRASTWSRSPRAIPDVPARVEKRTIADLADWPYPKQPARARSPRSCTTGSTSRSSGAAPGAAASARPGMITRPVRERPADQVRTMIAEGLRRTGYDEVALTSLSTADFCGIERGRGRHRQRPDLRRPGRRCRCPACGSTPSRSGIAAEIQKARRTGLTFAPEAGTWRMRQVINKLIPEEDLYGAVESAFSQGWRRMKLYFLTGLPTETDEDTLGIAELARRCVEIGRRHTQGRVGHGVGRRVRAQAVHAVPVVRPEHGRRAAAQDQPAARRHRAAAGACSSSGTTRRPRWSRASSAAATAGSARSSRTCGARGGTFQEWSEHFDLDLWVDAMAAPRAVDRLVRPPPPHRGRGAAVGPHLGRPAPGLPLAGLARRPGRARASRTAAGPRATTAGPAPATASSTSWPRPRRRPVAARAPARTWPGGGSPVTPCPVAAWAVRAVMRVRIRFTKLGKVRFTSHRDVARAVGAGAAPGRAARGLHRGLLAPSQGALRAGPADRPRVAGRVPRRRLPRRRRAPSSTSAALAELAQPAAARRHRRAGRGGRRRARDVAAAGGHQLHVDASRCTASTLDDGRRRPSAPARWPPSARRSPGSARATTSPTTSGPTSSTCRHRPDPGVPRRRATGSSPRRRPARRRAGHPAPGAAAGRAGRGPRARTVSEGRVCRTHQWITRDGARQEPLPAGATSATHALGWAS